MQKWDKQIWFSSTFGKFYVLPFVLCWYSEDYFLETGVTSPAYGLQIGFLKWRLNIKIQKGY